MLYACTDPGIFVSGGGGGGGGGGPGSSAIKRALTSCCFFSPQIIFTEVMVYSKKTIILSRVQHFPGCSNFFFLIETNISCAVVIFRGGGGVPNPLSPLDLCMPCFTSSKYVFPFSDYLSSR